MGVLRVEYMLFVFVAACGLMQVVAARSRLRGLLFLSDERGGYALGAGLIIVAFVWFFVSDNRNLPGIEGSGQFGLFLAGVFSAVAFTVLLSTLIKALTGFGRQEEIRRANPGHRPHGFEALKSMSYGQALVRGLLRRR